MKPIRLPILLAWLALVGASLACSMFIGGPDYPDTRIPVSEDAVKSLQEQIAQAAATGAQGGVVTLNISQEQLTSMLAMRLGQQQQPFITDPQVYLQDGQVKIYGRAKQGIFEANVGIVVTASVDAAGQPVVQLVSADFGPLPAPEGLNRTITTLVQEAFTGTFGPAAIGFRLESITITSGAMTLSGRIR